MARSALALLLVIALAACAPASRAPVSGFEPGDATHANDVLFRAIGLVGTPYRYGGNTPEGGFDCSGLVGYVFRDVARVSLPRSSRDIAALDAPQVEQRQLRAGDLVFFGRRDAVSHIGIYVGERRFVHAPSTGGTVRLDQLDSSYWREHFLYAKRVLR